MSGSLDIEWNGILGKDFVNVDTNNQQKQNHLRWSVLHSVCQGAVFMAAKFEVFPTLSLKTLTHFAFPIRTYQTNPLSLPPFPFISTNQTSTMGNNQLILDIFRSLLKTPY